ncbi:MAG: hypothetical protein GQ475_07320 [Methylococcaceae bacterium]|nr:hypothetical protein [Methylococcaceae bacterium]
MSPELKFHSTIISATTLIIFVIWIQLTNTISSHPIISIMATSLISLGIYRLLALLMLSAFRKNPILKKWLLGANYMEGTWVGFFLAHDNTPRFFIETFEQDISFLIIRGKAFKQDGTYHGAWVAENTEINTKLGRLTYTYNADIIDNSHTNPGLAVFNFERISKESPPHRMLGFSSDLFAPTKLKSFEEKISDETSVSLPEALSKAKKIYSNHKDHF